MYDTQTFTGTFLAELAENLSIHLSYRYQITHVIPLYL